MVEREKRVYHIISLSIIVLSAVFVALYFDRVWIRLWQSMKDIAASVVWLVKGEGNSTVNTIPENAVGVLPFDFSDFTIKLKAFGLLFIDWENIKGFFFDVAIWILLTVCVFIPWAIWIISAWLNGKKKRRNLKKVVHNFGQETKPLRIYKKIERVVWYKPKAFFKAYKDFVLEKKYYVVLFCVVWALGLNFATVALELLAYIVFLLRGFDLSKIYLQIAKLAMDLTVAIDFVPHFVWVYIGLKIFSNWRYEKGMSILEAYYEMNVEFLEEHKGSLFFVGRQRSGKSTILQAVAQMFNKIFRNNALKGMQKREKQFPDFPWQNVVETYRNAEEIHGIPKIETWRTLTEKLRLHYKHREFYSRGAGQVMLAVYQKQYGYDYDDFIFNYDDEHYKLKHNNGLVFVDIFQAISDYGQQFKIYSHGSSLIMANAPVRADLIWEDYGNFPVFDGNSLRRTPEEIEKYSQYAHVMQWDSLRISKFVDKNNPYLHGFEYGIAIDFEWAKDRGNQISNRGKKATSEEANPCNDGFETNMKVKGQMATIDNYDYFFFGGDDQRPDSISAENKDLCTIVTIAEKFEKKVVLPFYAIEQAIGLLFNGFYDQWKLDKKVLRDDRTLREYLFQKLFTPIYNHCERIENKFGVEGRRLKVEDGTTHTILSEKKVWWIIYAHDYNDKFTTNALQTYATTRARRSKYGLEDFPVYQSTTMTQCEMDMQGSYFYEFMNTAYTGENAS